jgi:hypothetical protein
LPAISLLPGSHILQSLHHGFLSSSARGSHTGNNDIGRQEYLVRPQEKQSVNPQALLTQQEEFTMKNGRMRLAALAGVTVIGMMAVPLAASASTHLPGPASSAHQHVIEVAVAGAASEHPDFSNQWVNCNSGSFGTSGDQEYFELSCSLLDATSWQNGVECSNGITYWSGSMTTFENSYIYCPAPYAAEEGYVSWTE